MQKLVEKLEGKRKKRSMKRWKRRSSRCRAAASTLAARPGGTKVVVDLSSLLSLGECGSTGTIHGI